MPQRLDMGSTRATTMYLHATVAAWSKSIVRSNHDDNKFLKQAKFPKFHDIVVLFLPLAVSPLSRPLSSIYRIYVYI